MKQVAIQGCQWEVDENGYMERGRFGRIRYKLHDTINIDNHIRTLSRLVTSTTPWHTESDFERAILYSCVNVSGYPNDWFIHWGDRTLDIEWRRCNRRKELLEAFGMVFSHITKLTRVMPTEHNNPDL